MIALALTGTYLDKYALFYPPKIDVKNIDQEHLDKFLKHFSLPINELRDRLSNEQRMNEKYAYAFNSLRAYPLIRMEYEGRDSIVCPIPPLLFRRITEGLYYEICKEPNFDSSFGNAFQIFVGELLKKANEKAQVIPERTYGKPEKRTVDWIVIDKSVLLFVECKGKRLTFEAKVSLTDTTELYRQLDIMANFIVQIYKTIVDYDDGKYPHLKFDKDKQVYPLLVTLEEWFLFGSQALDILDEKIRSKLNSLSISSKILDDKPYMICSVEGLDLLMQVSSKYSIDEIFRDKNKDVETRTWHLEIYIKDKYKEAVSKIKPLFKEEFNNHMDFGL